MSQGIATKIAVGRTRPDFTYIKLRNGAVYVYRQALSPAQQSQPASKVKENG